MTAGRPAGTAARLYEAAGDRWPQYEAQVVARLSSRPYEAVGFVLHTLDDPRRAWHLAHSLGLDSDHTWAGLAKAYETVDPIAVLPVYTRLVEQELVQADAKHYRNAARRLAHMRDLAAGTDHTDEVHDLIVELRQTHQRRPRLQREFDRADLPRPTKRR